MTPDHYLLAGLLLAGLGVAAQIWRLTRRGPRFPRLELTGHREPERSSWFVGILAALGLVVLFGLLDDLADRVREAEAAASRRLHTGDCPPPQPHLSETVVLTARLAADGVPTDVHCFRVRSREKA